MRIRTGYEIAFDCQAPTPMILMLSVRPERFPDLITPQTLHVAPWTPVREYRDRFGNVCHRLIAPPGRITFSADFLVADSGQPDEVAPNAVQHPVD